MEEERRLTRTRVAEDGDNEDLELADDGEISSNIEAEFRGEFFDVDVGDVVAGIVVVSIQ